jgi:hypothetical protein
MRGKGAALAAMLDAPRVVIAMVAAQAAAMNFLIGQFPFLVC